MLLKEPSRVSLCRCESVYSRLAGYEDTIDAQRLDHNYWKITDDYLMND